MTLDQAYLIIKKEFLHLVRNPRVLVIVIVVPMMMTILIGFAFSGDIKYVSAIIVNEDDGQASIQLLNSLRETTALDLRYNAIDQSAAKDLIARGEAKVAIVIPKDFSIQLKNGDAEIYVLLDGSDPSSSDVALSAVQKATQLFDPTISLKIGSVALFNPGMRYVNFLVPGAISQILQVLPTVLITFAIAGEREKGTIEKLISTPISSWDILLGKMLVYIVIGCLEAGLMITVAIVVFGIVIQGSVFLVALLCLLFVTTSVSLGTLSSVMAKNQIEAVQQVYPVIILSFFLSGVFYPVESMPYFIQPFSYIIPLTYMNHAMRSVMIKGATLDSVMIDVIVLFVYALFMTALAFISFKKKLG